MGNAPEKPVGNQGKRFIIMGLPHSDAPCLMTFLNSRRRITPEDRKLFAAGFTTRICRVPGLPEDPGMKSPLVKQGANNIPGRFGRPGPIGACFRKAGCGHWLEAELQEETV